MNAYVIKNEKNLKKEFRQGFFVKEKMSPPSHNGKESATARFLGAGCSGVLELLGFHPVDTVAKRLMTNSQKVSRLI